MSSVCPSAALFATASAAMLPPAPARFSITTGCPRRGESFSPTSRVSTSAAAPGPMVTKMRTGLDGYDCAAAATETASAATHASERNIGHLLCGNNPPATMRKQRAVIIGGSIGGLFAANLLQSLGWQVQVYERVGDDLAGRGA